MMDKNIKICIIGGGPAGLSAGMYLEKKGYENY
ncbi:MAG: FAD-dependent monooxygenase, partial [Solobacterium sp.]|nr:FAD-dependent monooxygenase [Solobacterium sp.]